MLPASTDTSIPDPYSHGYMYGGSAFALVDIPYPADMEAAAKAGTLQPIDYTHQNSSYAMGAGGSISTANDHLDPSAGRRPRVQRRFSPSAVGQPTAR
jgi:hypothetical protein